ncbi:hypothetical protein COLO4_36798 [Corchorus olitorius]|uniref:Uncharacterized protein n=1 Tax=Corchorus olitorius TaxID=93759 RepID=A0A1R3G5A3_9ROSI|nr:hypothetical protein COLO4_36798 [Corchorus olitorius]
MDKNRERNKDVEREREEDSSDDVPLSTDTFSPTKSRVST